MAIELLTIGTELLLGQTVDTNGAELGRALAAAGIPVVRRTSVTDDPAAIREATSQALARTGAVLTTGGLGPTADDITKKLIAELFGMPLTFRTEVWEALVARFARAGRVPAERNRCQAEVPEGAVILPNRWGTAPGLWLEGPPGLAILLPGVPAEMRGLLHHEVLPRLAPRAGGRVVRSRTLRTSGIPESSLAERLDQVEHRLAPLSLAYLPGVAGVDLRLTAWNLAPDAADAALAAGMALLREGAAGWAYGEEDQDLAALVLQAARERGLHLGTAESCTGGGIGARLTAIPGSSEVYRGGVVAYDNRLKVDLLGVPEELLARAGAVSAEVAEAMASTALGRLGADLAISVTGIAGPGGGTPEKPVGLVYLGLATRAGVRATRHQFPGDREDVRARAGQMALFRLLQELTGQDGQAGPTV
ncbi:MAG: competence/damage-inducible protein A [Gemmatimonadetes bacterium]|nr:competence/damage-inducible protein A [Gemmatimonadota bacterium]MBK7349087.1 competence/damage-inducible protein A [Gemmatimonadota bacterium]MBK7714651.1 competence/damage-inducible protein A [Gemmatimonadota bacterium]MBK7783716.1 competence/damage-inducible protein A [Gemmatimonadota bacterium]MBK9068237.1 competence/damage-inducible protein A [Gemmatimonadota bacterium]